MTSFKKLLLCAALFLPSLAYAQAPLSVAQGGTGLATLGTGLATAFGIAINTTGGIATLPLSGSGCIVSGGTSGQVLLNGGSDNCTNATSAVITAGSLALGASGTLGNVVLGNATSGTLTLQPVTGALGTVTASFPANTGTVLENNIPQTITSNLYINSGGGTPTSTIWLQVKGGDALGSSFALFLNNTTPVNLFTVTDSGIVTAAQGTVILGTSAAVNSSIQFFTSGTGSAVIRPSPGGTYGSTVLTLPATATTDTLATIGAAQTFSGAITHTALDTFSAHIAGGGTAPTITAGTATLDAQASDLSGTVTEGTTQTGFTLTFGATYTTVPHCVVGSPSGVVITSYAVTATTLAIVNASASADVFTYTCVK